MQQYKLIKASFFNITDKSLNVARLKAALLVILVFEQHRPGIFIPFYIYVYRNKKYIYNHI